MKWNKVLEANGIDVDLEDNEPSKLSYKKFEQYMWLSSWKRWPS
jgi:hypothetical protein